MIFAGEVRANSAEEFKAACMPKCASQGHPGAFCGKFCACNASEMQKKFGDKAFSKQPAGNVSPEEIMAIPSLCNLRNIEGYFDTVIARQCRGDADCAQVQRCVAKELGAMGEAEGGALMTAVSMQALGKTDAPRLAKYKQLTTTCVGRSGARSTEAGCMKSCGSDGECKKSCSCLGKKVAAVGSDLKIGEYLTKLGAGDAETAKLHKAALASCGLQSQ